MRNQIITGSVGDVAKRTNQSIATTFLSVDVVVLVDTSGSMGTPDSSFGRSRYEQACIELEKLQNNLPGKIGVISFSDRTEFCPFGKPVNIKGMTDLAGALSFAKIADLPSGMRFIVISDGEPDSQSEALRVAKTYRNKIDVIFVGNEAKPDGRDFLQRLAATSGGQLMTADRVKGLETAVQKLLAAA